MIIYGCPGASWFDLIELMKASLHISLRSDMTSRKVGEKRAKATIRISDRAPLQQQSLTFFKI